MLRTVYACELGEIIKVGYNLSFQFASAQGLQIRGKVLRLCVLGTELD